MLVVFQFGCSSESLGPGGASSASSACPAIGELDVEFQTSSFGGGADRCLVSGTLMTSATMQLPPNDVDWFLSGSITVDSGTLTINPGVSVFAEGADEYIYIANGGGINAVGTSSAPIVLSSNDDGESGGAEWGGLIIESMMLGGVAQRLEYVVVAEAGAEVSMSPRTYSANISFFGEHEDTEVRFLQSHASGNDGIALVADGDMDTEVNAALLESILVTDAADNSLYLDSFSGLLKNLLVIQDPASGTVGIRMGGEFSNPLIVNATLIGNDDSSQSGGNEFALFFEDGFQLLRIANSFLLNYRSGCYAVMPDADLSGMELNSIPDVDPEEESRFIDGVHCVSEFADTVDSAELPLAISPNLPSLLQGEDTNGDGLRFYDGETVAFAEDDDASITGSAALFLERIGSRENGTDDLKRYNDGDADNSGGAVDPVLDAAASPLLGIDTGLYSGISRPSGTLFGCVVPDFLPEGAEFRDEFGVRLIDQPEGTALTCGLNIFFPDQSSKFNLTVIGAIESATDDRFDDWTIDSSF